jgi:aryl-alcohol dehydrogenase-like predicted oxidoreductase
MTNRRLGSTDIEISPLGLGCWQFSQGKGLTGGMWSVLDQGTIDAVVGKALAGGMNWFDTAEAYGNGQSERALATALHNLHVAPGKVVIATKWLPLLRTAGNIPRTIGQRLSCLSGYPIDLYQIHLPWGFSSIAAEMRQMAGLQRASKIRSIGVSNFSARQMEKACQALQAEGMTLASNQVPISLLDRRIESNGVLAAAQRLGVTLIAYSPLAQGILSGRFHAHPELAGSLPPARRSRFSPASRAYKSHSLARTKPLIDELDKISKAYGTTISQVALAWLITFYGDAVVAIPGATRPEQAADCAAAMSLRLTENELARIEEASAPLAKR